MLEWKLSSKFYASMLQKVLSKLLDVFSETTLREALFYVWEEAGIAIRLSDGLLHSRVKEKKGRLLDVYLDLKLWPQQKARCTCNATLPCAHVAATLLFLRLKPHLKQNTEGLASLDAWIEKHTIAQKTSLTPRKAIDDTNVEWYSEVKSLEKGYLSYELGILLAGKKVNLVPVLDQLLSQYDLADWMTLPDTHLIPLVLNDKQMLSLPVSRLRWFVEYLLYEKETVLTQHAYQWKREQYLVMQAALEALMATSKRQMSSNRLIQSLHAFLNQSFTQTPLPKGFKTTLRDYQQTGLDWLQALREQGLGGILADDMGLGKTIQTLAHLLVEKTHKRLKKPVLIIAPLSVVGNWVNEAARFTPELRVLMYHGTKRHASTFKNVDLVITTYQLIKRDKDLFLNTHFYYVILDEAQWIKNASAQTTLMIQQLNADLRLCLSGTPFENHLGELWSLFHFIMPGLLGSKKQFKTYFQKPIEKKGDMGQRTLLMKRITPFLLRRTKPQVSLALPEKSLIIQPITLVGVQRDLYEMIRVSMQNRVHEAIIQHGVAKSRFIFLDALLKLRQVCCDPRLLRSKPAEKAYGHSAKLDYLMELLAILMAEGRRVLLFSQFTTMLSIIEAAVKEKGYSYLKLTGQTVNRQTLVSKFQDKKASLFLMSLKAGGVGLNLTAADTVIHYDPWWNPAVEDQATDRTHRIGQVNPVFVYRLVVESSIEEAMMVMQTKKRALFEGILSGQDKGLQGLTEEDIDLFFKPLAHQTTPSD